MADDSSFSDDDIRAAARKWFNAVGTGFREMVAELPPGQFQKWSKIYADRFLNPAPDEIDRTSTHNQRLLAAIDSFEFAGYEMPVSPSENTAYWPARDLEKYAAKLKTPKRAEHRSEATKFVR